MADCKHEWWVFGRELGTYDITRQIEGASRYIVHEHKRILIVKCRCGAFGTIDDPVDSEWQVAKYARLDPSPYYGDSSRVTARAVREF